MASLRQHPKLGPEKDELGAGRRILVERPYVIVYEILQEAGADLVSVLRVVHGARDLPELFDSE